MNGRVVGITAARRATEQAALVESLGGVALVGPSLGLDTPVADDQIVPALRELLDTGFDVLVAMTGVGMRHLMAVAERIGLADRMRAQCADGLVLARGAKARRALRELGFAVAAIADPASSAGVVALVGDRVPAGARIAVQSAFSPGDPVMDQIAALGHTVIPLHPYVIAPHAQREPALALATAAIEGRVDAITFTSANAVHGLAAICEHAGLDLTAIGPSVLIVAVGEVTAAALRAHDLRVDLQPDTPRMGAMYQALAKRFDQSPGTGGHSATPSSRSTR